MPTPTYLMTKPQHMQQTTILNDREIAHKIKRIAYQIYETFSQEEEIVLAGITTNGYIFAQKIAATLKEISDLQVVLAEVRINKKQPHEAVEVSIAPETYTNKGVVLVDDVLHTGTTLIYGVRHFLNVPLKKFKTVVLVDRNHKKYPVKADFKGLSLSTSVQEHVQVIFEPGNDRVILE